MATSPKVKPIPDGHHTVIPYMVVPNGVQLIDFLKKAFDAKELHRSTTADGNIMHASLQIGDSMVWLGGGGPQWTAKPLSLHLYVPNSDEVYKQAMQAGAKSLEEPVDQSYGDRESGIQDPSGNHWWISTHKLRGPTHYAPEGYHSVTLGLRVAGGLKLIEFLKNAFGAQEIEVTKQKDGTLIIATVRIGDSVVNVSEERGEWKAMPSYVFLYMKDVDAAYKQATGAGAESISEPADQFYGDRTCGVKDAWGNTWWIGTHVEDVSNEEIDRRAQAAGRK